MPKIARDLGFLIINTVLLAVIAYGVMNSLRVMQADVAHHRQRNEAENFCQLEALTKPLVERQDVRKWLDEYANCVKRRSGTESPIDLSKDK